MGKGEVLVGSDRSRSTQRVQAPQLSVRVAHTRVVRRRQGRQQNNDVVLSLSLSLSLSSSSDSPSRRLHRLRTHQSRVEAYLLR